jgi:hypothetical protein
MKTYKSFESYLIGKNEVLSIDLKPMILIFPTIYTSPLVQPYAKFSIKHKFEMSLQIFWKMAKLDHMIEMRQITHLYFIFDCELKTYLGHTLMKHVTWIGIQTSMKVCFAPNDERRLWCQKKFHSIGLEGK